MRFFLIFLLLFSSPAWAEKNTFYLNKVYDYPQTELETIIPNYDKGAFCAPSAASNILRTFHPDRVNQGEMIKLLASPDYMNTNPAVGTTVYDFMYGLGKYMKEYLGGYKILEYEGIGNYGEFNSGIQTPGLEWITDGLSMKKATWVIITLFKHDKATDTYHSLGGHLLTLVGYNVDVRNSILIVHDSASLENEGMIHDFLKLEPIQGGALEIKGMKIPATGFLKVVEGQNKHYATETEYDTVIVTGAIRLERN